ncbi:unnamed protein product [Umbelopsis sp. WA50703]|jgi:hypothetical protein
MLVRFSRKEFDKGTIVQIEVDKGKTYFLLHNPTSQDLVALIRYREYNFYPRGLFQKTLVIPPYTIERITGGQGHVQLWAMVGTTYQKHLQNLGLKGVSFKGTRQIDAKEVEATIEKYKETTLPFPANKVFTATVYKLSYHKIKNNKTFNCDLHRVIMPEGVDLYCVQNKTDEDLIVELNGSSATIGPKAVGFLKDKISSYQVKFVWLSKPSDTKDKRKIMTDELKSVGNFTYSNAEDFIKNELWSILSKSEQALEA